MKYGVPTDIFWRDAISVFDSFQSDRVLRLASSGLVEFSPDLFPLEFSWNLNECPFVFCASKDDVHRLAPWVFKSLQLNYLWANEVFVIASVGASRDQQTQRFEFDAQHLSLWMKLVDVRHLGFATYRRHALTWHQTRVKKNTSDRPLQLLVVGASGMGNVGDDLLAVCLRDILERIGHVEVAFADPDIDVAYCRGFDVIIAGPGGILYADKDGVPEYNNLVNYLKFAFFCESIGAEFWLIGIGDQQSNPIEQMPALVRLFWKGALARCNMATVRDHFSAALLRDGGVARVVVGQDMVFGLSEKVNAIPHPVQSGAARIALCGEWFAYGQLREISDQLCSAEGVNLTVGLDFQLLIFSEDDVSHVSRLTAQLRKVGHSVSVSDARHLSFERLCYLLKGCNLLVTTRFHAMVLAMLCKIKFLVADSRNGKKHRLLQQFPEYQSGCLVDETSGNLAKQSIDYQFLKRLTIGMVGLQADPHVTRQLVQSASVHEITLIEKIENMQENMSQSASVTKSHTPDVVQVINGTPQVRLCWAASTPESEGYGNLGDSLSAAVVGALSGLQVTHTNFDAPGDKLVAVGSIAHSIRGGKAVLWGPGVSIRGGVLADNVPHTEYDVRAMRGEISASHLKGFGITVPEIYGDPVWLLPSIFNEPIEKKYELGVIPHILDIEGHGPDAPPKADSLRYVIPPELADQVVIINTWHVSTWEGIVEKLRMMLSCKRILSQSFHGVVIGETYKIPVMNFRHLPGRPAGVVNFSTAKDCTTDPRIYEFYKAAGVDTFPTYAQRRDKPSDWPEIIKAIDANWKPLVTDLQPLVDAFPLPLAYDPLRESCVNFDNLHQMRF